MHTVPSLMSPARPRFRLSSRLRLCEERSIAAAEYVGQRRGQEEGNQNPGDEEIKEHGAVSLRWPIFDDEADRR